MVIDADGVLIAGNGVASVTDGHTPVKVIETDGSELVVVKRTDLHEGDVKRKKLAMADNAAGDRVEWDENALQELEDFGVNLDDFDLHLSVESATAGLSGYDNKEQSEHNYAEQHSDKLQPNVIPSGVGYQPNLNPIDGSKQITENDIERAGVTIIKETIPSEKRTLQVTCPNCGETFEIHI